MKTLAPILLLLVTDLGATNPVTVTLDTPTNGATISGTITLQSHASSTMGPIVRVEWYMDNQLIAVVTNPISPASNLHIDP